MPIARLHRHREFIGQIGTIMSGRVIAAAVSLVLTPVVARLFLPHDFGIAAQFIAIVGITGQVASLRYEIAIALPKSDAEAQQIASVAYAVLPAFCFLMLVVIAVLKLGGFSVALLDYLGNWAWLLPVAVLFGSAQDIQESWLAREHKFGVISGSVVLDISVGQAMRIASGVAAGSTVGGLIAAVLCGNVSRLVMQGRASAAGIRGAFRSVDWRELRDVARRYSDFATLNAPAGLLYSFAQNLPVLAFGVMYSPAAAGFYAMANRLSRMPVQIVVNAIRRVFLQKAANIHNRGGTLRRSFVLTSLALVGLGAIPALAIGLYGQPILGWLLGPKWLDAGRFIEIMAPWVLSAWAAAPCNALFIVLRRQRLWLSLLVWTTVLRIGSFLLGHALGFGPEAMLELFVAASVAVHVLLMFISYRLAGLRPAAEG
jgi:O-antigen/teichoic acid export membrane protein